MTTLADRAVLPRTAPFPLARISDFSAVGLARLTGFRVEGDTVTATCEFRLDPYTLTAFLFAWEYHNGGEQPTTTSISPSILPCAECLLDGDHTFADPSWHVVLTCGAGHVAEADICDVHKAKLEADPLVGWADCLTCRAPLTGQHLIPKMFVDPSR